MTVTPLDLAAPWTLPGARAVTTVDSHTDGEPTRLVVAGVDLPGATMAARRAALAGPLTPLRHRLLREPRGHRDLFGAVLTSPVTPGAAFGLVYMDAVRCPHLCGHATMGAVTTLINLGRLPAAAPETTVTVDTPSGPVQARAQIEGGRATRVSLTLPWARVHAADLAVDLPGHGPVRGAVVLIGGFLLLVDAAPLGLTLTPAEAPRIVALGEALRQAANAQHAVADPDQPHATAIDGVELYRGDRAVVIYGDRHADRSPCGTGTAAKLALLHHQDRLRVGETHRQMGLLGTTFQGRLLREVELPGGPAVIPEVSGRAWITGLHRFTLEADDPFPAGYRV